MRRRNAHARPGSMTDSACLYIHVDICSLIHLVCLEISFTPHHFLRCPVYTVKIALKLKANPNLFFFILSHLFLFLRRQAHVHHGAFSRFSYSSDSHHC